MWWGNRKPTNKGRQAKTNRLGLEALEGRVLLASNIGQVLTIERANPLPAQISAAVLPPSVTGASVAPPVRSDLEKLLASVNQLTTETQHALRLTLEKGLTQLGADPLQMRESAAQLGLLRQLDGLLGATRGHLTELLGVLPTTGRPTAPGIGGRTAPDLLALVKSDMEKIRDLIGTANDPQGRRSDDPAGQDQAGGEEPGLFDKVVSVVKGWITSKPRGDAVKVSGQVAGEAAKAQTPATAGKAAEAAAKYGARASGAGRAAGGLLGTAMNFLIYPAQLDAKGFDIDMMDNGFDAIVNSGDKDPRFKDIDYDGTPAPDSPEKPNGSTQAALDQIFALIGKNAVAAPTQSYGKHLITLPAPGEARPNLDLGLGKTVPPESFMKTRTDNLSQPVDDAVNNAPLAGNPRVTPAVKDPPKPGAPGTGGHLTSPSGTPGPGQPKR